MEIGALGISFNLVDTILSVLDEFEEYNNIKKMLVLDSKTTALLLTQEPIKFKSSVSSILSYAQGMWKIGEIVYLQGNEMDKLADIGTHDWKNPELSWRQYPYLKGGIFNSPKETWPVLQVRSFMKADLSKFPF